MTKARRKRPSEDDGQTRILQRAAADAQAVLRSAADHIDEILDDEPFESETPVEVTSAMTLASEGIHEAIRILRDAAREPRTPSRPQGSRRSGR